MDRFIINGGNKLEGSIKLKGAKNSVLPIMAATILNEGKSIIHNVPDISDVHVMIDILSSIGCYAHYEGGTLIIDSSNINSVEVQEEYVRKMRASIIIMGAMIGRFEYTKISYPGGCGIGSRPIDLHLKAIGTLGIRIEEEYGYINCYKDKFRGNDIHLDMPSVGATENAMLAAAKANGMTRIYNAAREPEIEDLQNFLNAMGAKVRGAGSTVIEIEGVDKLNEVEHSIIPDRIAIGTYLVAGAITGGKIEIDYVIQDHVNPIVSKLKEAGCEINYTEEGLYLVAPKVIKAIDVVKTSPHPGFPTDMQSQLMTLMALSDGISIFYETIFENRFMHCPELMRMGANIKIITDNVAMIKGVDKLTGARVKSTDLRGGASLILAGLIADGTTEVYDIHHVERGYEDIENILRSLGADIKKAQ